MPRLLKCAVSVQGSQKEERGVVYEDASSCRVVLGRSAFRGPVVLPGQKQRRPDLFECRSRGAETTGSGNKARTAWPVLWGWGEEGRPCSRAPSSASSIAEDSEDERK